MAGHYRSYLDVPNNADALTDAIEGVIASFTGNQRDQVLVQEMVDNVERSGAILTHDINAGSPYYIIEYADGSKRTDVVTQGGGRHKTVIIHRDARAHQIRARGFRRLLELTREVEGLYGEKVLNLEFAQRRDGSVFLLQARSIPVSKHWDPQAETTVREELRILDRFVTENSCPSLDLAGRSTILGQMPDWNPAELIGPQPSPLAASLFRNLITDTVWQQARAQMGYRPVPRRPLMLLLAGRPYVDVRRSFNSFLPDGLPEFVQGAIVDAWLRRLHEQPELHDKVEFQVAQTTLDLAFEETHRARYQGVLSGKELALYTAGLRKLTNENVSLKKMASLPRALRVIERLERVQSKTQTFPSSLSLRRALQLVEECRQYGTFPFAVIARHAFIAEAMLRSTVECGALKPERLNEFRRSLTSVATQMSCDFTRVLRGEMARQPFLRRYGHLRPGSFDITSPRYDRRPDLFSGDHVPAQAGTAECRSFALSSGEACSLDRAIKRSHLGFSAEELISYATWAIEGREHAKFVFSRHLSDILEAIAASGKPLGLSREDLSFLTVDDLSGVVSGSANGEGTSYFRELLEPRRAAARRLRGVRLGCLIRNAQDLSVIPFQSSCPNFITFETVEGPRTLLENRTSSSADLFGRIVCIENADPGFDWIFVKGIAGLITKFGGANSHMAVRCAEMAIPAAIGVGEAVFEKVLLSGAIELNCRRKVVRPVYH